MNAEAYIVISILAWAATGLSLAAFMLLVKKLGRSNILKYIIPVGVLALFDILYLVGFGNEVFPPLFTSTIAGGITASYIRNDGVPTTHPLTVKVKVFMFLFPVFLMTGIYALIASCLFSYLPTIQFERLMTTFSIPIIFLGLVFAFSDPTNRYRQRNSNALVGVGITFIGVAVGIILLVTGRTLVLLLDILAISMSLAALSLGVFMFLGFMLSKASTPTAVDA